MKILLRIAAFVVALFFILTIISNFKIWPGRGNLAVTLFFLLAVFAGAGLVSYALTNLWLNKEATLKRKLLFTIAPAAALFIASAIDRQTMYMSGAILMLLPGLIIGYLIFKASKRVFEDIGDKKLKQHFENEKLIRGSKNWATKEQLLAAVNPAHNGLNIGAATRWSGQGHVLTVGGTRGGKGVNLVIPALLDAGLRQPDAPSFVVLDPKGENLAITGNYLRRSGYKVFSVNPFSIAEIIQFGNARFNPFDLFTADDQDFDKYADMIAYALVPEAHHANDYFDKSARGYITVYIRHMMTQDDEPKNFRTLYKWLRLAGSDRITLLQAMSKNEAFDGDVKSEARAIAGQLLNDGGRTVESVYSTIRTVTDVFKDAQLRESVSTSDIDLKVIAKEKTAIFVCLNPSDLARCQAWLRLFFGSVMRGLQKYYSRSRRVTLLMDEFPTMGALKEFETAAGFLAGYNVTLWPVIQDLTQLKTLYPNSWETFVSNAIIKHYLAIGDNFTADYLSKRMPNSLIYMGLDSQTMPKYSEKPLLTAQEVQSFQNIILEVKGLESPVNLVKTPYYTWPDNGSDPNPFR